MNSVSNGLVLSERLAKGEVGEKRGRILSFERGDFGELDKKGFESQINAVVINTLKFIRRQGTVH